MSNLKVREKFDLLWDDFLQFVEDGIEKKLYPKDILQNFKLINRDSVKGFAHEGKGMPSYRELNPQAVEKMDGKILLSLEDIAILIEADKADWIAGAFKGFSLMLEKYLETRDPSLFNQVNVVMNEMVDNTYMPYLNIKGRHSLVDEGEALAAFRPGLCRQYPFYFDFASGKVAWEEDAPAAQTPISDEEKEEIIASVIAAQNNRLKDIVLIMLNRENLKRIGFEKYF